MKTELYPQPILISQNNTVYLVFEIAAIQLIFSDQNFKKEENRL